ncbi:MAG: glycosyltransferase family 39 protein [Planctomycetes bacterium]|nr:glycosyltransferase family 39 protein [Planctomycetota bacterium]
MLLPFALAALLLIHAALLAWSAAVHSPNTDEPAQLVAGISHWQLGRFELYRVTAPIVRLTAAVPVLLAQPETDWRAYRDSPGSRAEAAVSQHFIEANAPRIFWLITLARWACIPFSLVGGYLCFRWARELYGPAPGLMALALWCFSPNILAHGSLMTTDAAGAALCVLAAYALWRWLRFAGWRAAALAGLALGLVQLTKATFLVLFGLWPLVWLLWRWTADRGARGGVRGEAAQLAATLGVALYVLNLGYGFEGSFKRLGEYEFVSPSLAGTIGEGRHSGNRFRGTWLSGVPLPFPENYVRGIDTQRKYFERKLPSYLRGEWKLGGWWYYYLYGLAIKIPLGTWLLFALALGWRLSGRIRGGARSAGEDRGLKMEDEAEGTEDGEHRTSSIERRTPNAQPGGGRSRSSRRDELVLLAPAVAVLALVSSQTGFNKNLRYVLPCLPFAFIWISRVFQRVEGRESRVESQTKEPGRAGPARQPPRAWRRAFHALAVGALAWSIASSLWFYPHSLSYFNELVGGPARGHEHLIHTNIDWGQDLLFLKDWLDEHPEARPLHLAYYGPVDPKWAGIEHALPPRMPRPDDGSSGTHDSRPSLLAPQPPAGPHPGWHAASINTIHGHGWPIPDGQGRRVGVSRSDYGYFLEFEPVARAGYSIFIYHITLDEANRVRREFELPELLTKAEGNGSRTVGNDRQSEIQP